MTGDTAPLCLLALPTPAALLGYADRAAIDEMNRYLLTRQRARWDTAALCLLALPRYGKRTERSPRTGLAYTVGGWRWPFLPWPRNRAGLGSGAVVWHHKLARLCLLALPLTDTSVRRSTRRRLDQALAERDRYRAARGPCGPLGEPRGPIGQPGIIGRPDAPRGHAHANRMRWTPPPWHSLALALALCLGTGAVAEAQVCHEEERALRIVRQHNEQRLEIGRQPDTRPPRCTAWLTLTPRVTVTESFRLAEQPKTDPRPRAVHTNNLGNIGRSATRRRPRKRPCPTTRNGAHAV